ncbi:50S ribosomal protein L20 [Candidatus Uhrbacteria bacterium]|nr:50S ribosomal protein L20 [Candidatus Uhrbacteria bacterium]MBD3284518.1 50S ribosomal protein L20 [Candidatus Uhrbacteria bacterium]
MPRVKRGTTHVKRRKNVLSKTKGMMWGRKNKIKLAKTATIKAGAHARTGRKLKKRTNRNLMTTRVNAAAREAGTTYSKLIAALKDRKIELDRKVLSEIAMHHPEVFKKIIAE